MRFQIALLVLVIGAVGWPAAAHAEKVRTNQSAKLYNRAGEQGKVILQLKEGQTMTVLARDGRWLKVRVSGRTGFVPRSKVDMPEGDDIVRNTRRRPFVDGRSTKRGFGGEAPEDRIGADATEDRGDDAGAEPEDDEPAAKRRGGDDDDDAGAEPTGRKARPRGKVAARTRAADDDDEPADALDAEEDARPSARVKSRTSAYAAADPDSDEAFTASPSTPLFLTGTKKGKYTEVENEDGDVGFVLTSKLKIIDAGDGAPAGPRRRELDAGARLGVTLIGQKLRTTNGVSDIDNYNLGTSAFTIALGGALLYPYKARYVVGGELSYDLAKAVPGLDVGMNRTTGITVHDLNLRAIAGYDLRKKNGMMVFARLGYKYQSYQVSDVEDLTKNLKKLPSEILKSPTIGAALAVPRLTGKIGAVVSLDAMLIGTSLQQTTNLEDGANPRAKGVNLGIGVSYRWRKQMDIRGLYELNYASLNFGAASADSMRGHPAGEIVTRSDLFHAVTVGVDRAF